MGMSCRPTFELLQFLPLTAGQGTVGPVSPASAASHRPLLAPFDGGENGGAKGPRREANRISKKAPRRAPQCIGRRHKRVPTGHVCHFAG
jgi:hypothetical protein